MSAQLVSSPLCYPETMLGLVSMPASTTGSSTENKYIDKIIHWFNRSSNIIGDTKHKQSQRISPNHPTQITVNYLSWYLSDQDYLPSCTYLNWIKILQLGTVSLISAYLFRQSCTSEKYWQMVGQKDRRIPIHHLLILCLQGI